MSSSCSLYVNAHSQSIGLCAILSDGEPSSYHCRRADAQSKCEKYLDYVSRTES